MPTDQKPIHPRPAAVNARRGGVPYADIPPITPQAAAAEPPAEQVFPPDAAPDAKEKRMGITLSTTVQHRGRAFTITATDIKLDAFCDLLDQAGYAAPEQTQQWQTLPDGTPICPKHHAPMRRREKQGDSWYSHQVIDSNGAEVYCKGYKGKDSPGYDY